MDFLIVGLGNPGEKYEHTRHNAGFMAIDVLAERCGAKYWKNKGGAQVAECTCAGHPVLLSQRRIQGHRWLRHRLRGIFLWYSVSSGKATNG